MEKIRTPANILPLEKKGCEKERRRNNSSNGGHYVDMHSQGFPKRSSGGGPMERVETHDVYQDALFLPINVNVNVSLKF